MRPRHLPRHARPRPPRSPRARVATITAIALTLACTVGLALPSQGGSGGGSSPPPAGIPAAAAGTGRPGAAAPAAEPRPATAPSRLQIPAIGVDSDLMSLGLRADGSLEVPPSGFPAGYYEGAPVPGDLGPAVVTGHVDWDRRPGVFAELRRLEVGDGVSVTRTDGSTAVFRVTQVRQYAKDAFPTAEVYGDIDHPGLRLITCGGEFDRRARSYEDNVVVFAELAQLVPAQA